MRWTWEADWGKRFNHLVFMGDSIEAGGKETRQGHILPLEASGGQRWALLSAEKRLIRNGARS